jgi:putative ABC transport system permease protein
MLIFKLAYKNIIGAGLRTWLNVVVLSFAFVAIIFTQGLYQGMNKQAVRAMIDFEIGGGQYWCKNYDPYDPLTLQDAHVAIPQELNQKIQNEEATPILVIPGTGYPNGRIQPLIIKGINPNQKIIQIPSSRLNIDEPILPGLIGGRMSKSLGLQVGDILTVRWRDIYGTFDARDIEIVYIMHTTVQSIDQGQIWIPLDTLQTLTKMENHATIIVMEKNGKNLPDMDEWEFKNLDYLLSDIKELVKSKSLGASIIYIILILLAMLAIFDTQVLSIFRRRKEMGTLMALGLTRFKLIQLFTLEGALHGVLAAIVAAIYGIPILTIFAQKGWALPEATDSYGFAIGEKLFPSYSIGLVVGTTLLVLIITTIVSFLPTRKIAKLKPTDALRGKMT